MDAEVCEVAKAARAILLRAMGEGREAKAAPVLRSMESLLSVTTVQQKLLDAVHHSIKSQNTSAPTDLPPTLEESESTVPCFNKPPSLSETEKAIFKYISDLCAQLVVYGTAVNPAMNRDDSSFNTDDTWRYAVAMTESSEWNDCVVPYIFSVRDSYKSRAAGDVTDTDISAEEKLGEAAKSPSGYFEGVVTDNTRAEQLSSSFRHAALGEVPDSQEENNANDSNLCDIEFSLAFGGKILLHNTHLRLGRGRRYGLMGKNGAGKTTLLTNIGSGNGVAVTLSICLLNERPRSLSTRKY